MSTAREIQESAWDAECRRDLDALLNHFHSDAKFYPAGGSVVQGHSAIREMTEDFYSKFPELDIEILGDWNNEELSAAFEFRARTRDTEGTRFNLDGVCLVEIENGKFTTVRYYEDSPSPVTN